LGLKKEEEITMKISQTAYINGVGTDRYKSCAGLTKSERQAALNGEIVIFDSGYLSNGNSGTKLRIAYKSDRGWKRRVPTDLEITEYEKITNDTSHKYTPKSRIEKNSDRRKRYTAANQRKNAFMREQQEIESCPSMTLREAAQRGLITIDGIGINHEEQEKLLDTETIRTWNEKTMIYETQLFEPAQWREYSRMPHSPTGCLPR